MNIFQGYRLKNLYIKNRIVLPPLVRFSKVGTDGYVTPDLVEWYRDVAEGEAGMIIVEASCVDPKGKLRNNQIGIWDDSFIPGLKEIADICHKSNTPTIIQIHHAGFGEKISEVSTEKLDEILDMFLKAFKRAKEAGFDGIEMHGAHTYLLSQLNSRVWNKRNDKYAITPENRVPMSREIIEETKEIFDENFILCYRMGGNEPHIEDGIEIARTLEKLGVDILHVSNGVPDPELKQEVKIDVPEDFPLDWVIYMGVVIKKHVNIPVIGVRKIKEEKDASWLVENNLLDFVAVGRGMIARPDWVKWAKSQYEKRTGKSWKEEL
ncbi:MAG: NADH:flavin oxidoreductase [Fusobacteriaceae bacterium]